MKEHILFPNLLAEMVKKGETRIDIAKLLNIAIPSITYRFQGKVEWRLNEIITLCKHYNKNFEELFGKGE